MRLRTLFIGSLLSVLAAAASANLVTNGDFEDGDFTGWDTTGIVFGPTFVSNNPVFGGLGPHGGDWYAALGAVSGDDVFFQNIATVIGQSYDVSFWLGNDGDTPNDFTATFGANTVLSVVNLGQQGYALYSGTFVATANSTTLAFASRNDPGYLSLDDVSVNNARVLTPEPITMSLGIAGIGLFVRRRKQTK